MTSRPVSPWMFWLWIGLILFSQTALAGRLVDAVIGVFVDSGPMSDGWLRFVAQKGYHVALFGGMGALLAMRSKPASTIEMLGWCVGFSALAESLQMLSTNRHASIWDALLNIASAYGGYAISVRANGPDSRQGFFAPRLR